MAFRILVVDADPTVQRALGNALMGAGYEVVSSSEGLDALKLWKSERPALVLLAATLGNVDGLETLGQLRFMEGPSSHTPIIVLLSEKQSDLRVKALRAGADDYLMKPFHPAELIARMRSLLSRYAPAAAMVQVTQQAPVQPQVHARKEPARVVVFYGAKGGVGTTTVAINTAIALQRELQKKVILVDANLQFGDHRVFLDLGLDKKGIVDLATAPGFDLDLIRQIVVRHESGIDLLLAPPSPEMAELVNQDVIPQFVDQVKDDYDYVVVDIDKRLDEINLRVMDMAQCIYVVLTADLPCLKNVRLVLETISHLGYEEEKVKLVLNRSNAFTGINVKNAESALKRRIDYQIVNEYRASIGALNSGAPFMYGKADSILGRNILEFSRGLDRDATERALAHAAAEAAR